MENLLIEIYSYKLSLKDLINFVDKLDLEHRNAIEKIRNNKKFIYSLIGSGDNNNYDREVKNIWDECEFKSTRNFNNLFFAFLNCASERVPSLYNSSNSSNSSVKSLLADLFCVGSLKLDD